MSHAISDGRSHRRVSRSQSVRSHAAPQSTTTNAIGRRDNVSPNSPSRSLSLAMRFSFLGRVGRRAALCASFALQSPRGGAIQLAAHSVPGAVLRRLLRASARGRSRYMTRSHPAGGQLVRALELGLDRLPKERCGVSIEIPPSGMRPIITVASRHPNHQKSPRLHNDSSGPHAKCGEQGDPSGGHDGHVCCLYIPCCRGMPLCMCCSPSGEVREDSRSSGFGGLLEFHGQSP